MKWITLLTLAIIIAPSIQTNVRQCSNNAPIPFSVIVNKCKGSPCWLKKGEPISVAVGFKTNYATKTLRPELKVKKFGIRFGMDVPYFLENACQSIVNTTCPLNADQSVIYSMKMKLNAFYPSVSVEVEITFVGDNNRPITCFAIDVEIY